jgi:hypothetical protein
MKNVQRDKNPPEALDAPLFARNYPAGGNQRDLVGLQWTELVKKIFFFGLSFMEKMLAEIEARDGSDSV